MATLMPPQYVGQHLLLGSETNMLEATATLYTMALWAMMVLLPNWEYTIKLLRTPFCLLPHLLLYMFSAAPTYPHKFDLMIHPASVHNTTSYSSILLGIDSLDRLAVAAPHSVLDLHLLTLNLFVGRWIFWEGRHNLPHAVLALCLLLTILNRLEPFGAQHFGAVLPVSVEET